MEEPKLRILFVNFTPSTLNYLNLTGELDRVRQDHEVAVTEMSPNPKGDDYPSEDFSLPEGVGGVDLVFVSFTNIEAFVKLVKASKDLGCDRVVYLSASPDVKECRSILLFGGWDYQPKNSQKMIETIQNVQRDVIRRNEPAV